MALIVNNIEAELSAKVGSIEVALRVQNVVYVKKNPGPGEYSSIKTAVDAISGASASNQYLVAVGPGVYIEDTITLKQWVAISGTGPDPASVVIEVDSTAKDVIVGIANSYIANITLRGATDSGKMAVKITPTVAGTMTLSNVSFGDNDTFVSLVGDTVDFNVLISHLTINGTATTGLVCEALSGQSAVLRISDVFATLASSITTFVSCSGSGSRAEVWHAVLDGQNLCDTFAVIDDAAVLSVSMAEVFGFDTGIEAANVGSAPTIEASNCILSCVTNDLLVSHASTAGHFIGVADNAKVSVASSSLFLQYADKVSPQTGLNMGGKSINNVDLVDGVDVSSHASRHLPAGADPLTTAAASTLDATSSNTVGTANSFARSDHTHDLSTGAASAITPDQANAEGSSANLARADHVHNLATAAASTLGANSTNTTGTANSLARSDHTHDLNTGAVSAITPDQANAEGTSDNLARADHVHNLATAAASTLNANSTNTVGTANSLARSDHTHDLSTGAASSQTPDQANAEGASANLARADHVHNLATATAVNVGAANAQGAASSFARSDHVHQGVHSAKVESGGTERYGDITFAKGDNTTIVDSSGTFTFHSYNGKATTSTTDATVTTIATIATANDTCYMIEASIVARRTGGASGTAGDSAVYVRRARIMNIGGTATAFNVQADYTSEDQAGWNATIDTSGADARIRITGAAGNNVSWSCSYRIYSV